jgi:outer membrane protein TolC
LRYFRGQSACLHHEYVAQIPSPSTIRQLLQIPESKSTQARSRLLTLDEALRLANAQASTFQSAMLNERIAAEDVRQAQAAFLPKVSAPLSYIYTTPALGLPPGEPRAPSFIASDAIGVTRPSSTCPEILISPENCARRG